MCNDYIEVALSNDGKERIWKAHELVRIPILAHADIERPTRFVYILKLSDATFYIGQTNDLHIRLQEHKDGQQTQTRGKNPKMVYFESFNGMRRNEDYIFCHHDHKPLDPRTISHTFVNVSAKLNYRPCLCIV